MQTSPTVLFGLVLCAWIGNLLYALGDPGGSLKTWSPAIVAAAMTWFTFTHCRSSYGTVGVLGFVAIVFTLGWLFESVSIFTGFPFGRYHYTDLMAPFVGRVPVFVMPAYCIMGYICWSLARLFWGVHGAAHLAAADIRVPVSAAAMMVIWDLSLDPLRATVEGRWIWNDGGSYYGVPLSNFVGWFIVTWAMFQTFTVFLARHALPRSTKPAASPAAWAAMALMYCAFPVEYLANGILSAAGTSAVNVTQKTVYTEIAVICAVTMLPLTVFGLRRAMAGSDGSVPQRQDETDRSPIGRIAP